MLSFAKRNHETIIYNSQPWFNYGNFATNDAESYDNNGINNGTNINFQRKFHLIYNLKTN